jgi:hypothetical protein
VHLFQGEKQPELVVSHLMPADSGDAGQLREHPHGLAMDREVTVVMPLELAVPSRCDREACGVGFHAKAQRCDEGSEG